MDSLEVDFIQKNITLYHRGEKILNVDLKKFYQGKKIFVTGHTGFKGSWLCAILLQFEAKVKGYSLAPTTKPSLFEDLNLSKKMDSIIADIRDLEVLKKEINTFKPEIVIHLAAQPLVRESYQNPVDTFAINVMGSVNVLEACKNVSSIKSIVNVTTDKVYLNREWEYGYREDERLCGFDPYSNSKSCAELVTYSYKNAFYSSEDSPALSTARSGNVIGGGDYSANRIVPDCVRATKGGEKIIIRNPYSTRPYQHVLDCLNGYLILAMKTFNNKGLASSYNFGPNEMDCIKTKQLVELFCQNVEAASYEIQSDNGPHEAQLLRLDCSRARKRLGWIPTWGIEKALKETTDWYKKYINGGCLKSQTDKQIKEFFDI